MSMDSSSVHHLIRAVDYNISYAETETAGVMSTAVESHKWVLIVDAVILSLTLMGAGMIVSSMAWFEYKGRPSTTRMRIVQSLVLSDFAMGVFGMIGVASSLSSEGLHPGRLCDGIGIGLLTVIWTQHMWTMILAIATFMILIYPLHTVTLWLEKNWWMLWIGVWILAAAITCIGYGIYGLVPSGGICYYKQSGLYGELMQFIPRATVFLVITILYAKLFVFLRRPDKIRSPYSNSTHSSSTDNNGFLRRSRISGLFKSRDAKRPQHATRPGTFAADYSLASGPPNNEISEVGNPIRPTMSRSNTGVDPNEIPPWEKVELPVFQVDGQRFGGASTNLPTSASAGPGLWNGWKGMNGKPEKKRPSTASSASPPARFSIRFGSASTTCSEPRATKGSGGTHSPGRTPRLDTIPATFDDPLPVPEDEPSSPVSMQRRSSWLGRGVTKTTISEFDYRASLSPISSRQDPIFQPSQSALPPTFTRRASAGSPKKTFAPLTEIGEHSRRASAAAMSSQASRKSSGPEFNSSEKCESLTPTMVNSYYRQDSGSEGYEPSKVRGSSDTVKEFDEPTSHDDEEQGQVHVTAAEEVEWDFLKMLKETEPEAATDKFAPPKGETVELVEESMASYLNRKTALLMLWFPLGYVLLFSVSLIRIIYDFVGKPPVPLRAVSRWFIFAQGILDAFIYGYVEWHTKRVVRRRVRKGTFSPSHSHNNASSSWPRSRFAAFALGSKNSQNIQSQTAPTHSALLSVGRGQTGSIQPESETASRTGQQVVLGGIMEEGSISQALDAARRASAQESILTKGSTVT